MLSNVLRVRPVRWTPRRSSARSARSRGWSTRSAELSRSEIAPAEFYDAMLNKVVAALAAPGGAVWTIADTGGLQLAYQINLRQTGLIENPIGQQQHGRLLRQVMHGTEGALVAPHSGTGDATDNDEDAAANPTDFLLVLAPVLQRPRPAGRGGSLSAARCAHRHAARLPAVPAAGVRVRRRLSQGPPAAPSVRKANAVGAARNVHAHGPRKARRPRKPPTRSPTKAGG